MSSAGHKVPIHLNSLLLIVKLPSADTPNISVDYFQDCAHNATYHVIKSFADEDPTISVVTQPDLSEIPLPKAKVKFRGYYKIARHYKFALNHVLETLGHDAVIIVEGECLGAKRAVVIYFEGLADRGA